MKTQQEIRNSFLDFFRNKGHKIVPSASVIPHDDPTLLFTNAGMNQFKPFFLGSAKPDFPRAADTQKCLRVSGKHNDLDEVGRDTYHHTFFEMLGNWSFGDYFKKEAIMYAWEFLTEVCGLDKTKLYATYFGGDEKDSTQPDEEAASLWRESTDINPDHILPFGKKDNFWEMGDTGPCGPCSEIHIDIGEKYCDKKHLPGHVCQVNGDCMRYMEIWNLVFIQFNRSKDRSLAKLDKNHVDTGMGFERLTSILQEKYSNYETDLFTPLLDKITELTGIKYGASPDTDVAMRVCADHIKALCFAVTDGAVPDKKGRGSVLRSLLRRASRFGMQNLGMKEPFVFKLVNTVGDIYSDIFPEIKNHADYISKIVLEEEKLFGITLEQGLIRFKELADSVKAEKDGAERILPGAEAYRLYHQDGFPKDLIMQMAAENNMRIDEDGWSRAEKEHRERSKGEIKEAVFDPQLIADLNATDFLGYWEEEKALKLGTCAQSVPLRMPAPTALVLDSTPFYAQSGGQVGDTGIIEGENFLFKVEDTKKTGDFVVHYGILEKGSQNSLPQTVTASVNYNRRKALMAAHTATHLLQYALRTVLGSHVNQKGSEVSPDALRFDFTHPKQITQEELRDIERIVNEKILENQDVDIYKRSLDEAKADGVTALFGEKYGSVVRVIDIGGYSRELCGGTHCRRTGDIGSFRIVSESSSEAGVRRIEAVTGRESLKYADRDRELVRSVSHLMAARPEDILKRIEAIMLQMKDLKKQREKDEKKDLGGLCEELVKSAELVNEIHVVVKTLTGLNSDALASLADDIRSRDKICGIIVSNDGENINVIGFASKDIAGKDKINIGSYIRDFCKSIGGGGGGRFDFAKGGGKDVSKIADALKNTGEALKANCLK